MAPTSDERREVARRIRNNLGEKASWVIPWAVFNDADHHGDRETMERLADLIDPTCHIVTVEDCDGDLTEVHDCCGDKHTRDAFTGRALTCCPGCGARVVSDDADGAR